jgi:dephospho-CoA kinase
MNAIVAFVGMTGSGKSTAAECLIERKWTYIRFGQVTIDSLKEKGLDINEQNERTMRESLRKTYGMGAFATLSLPAIKDSIESNNVVIDGLYSWSEYNILRENFGERLFVIAVYASPATRYKRLESRFTDGTDTAHKMRPLTPHDARQRDYSEIENIEKGGPIAMADYTVVNEKSSSELRDQIAEIVTGITGS